MNSQKTETMTGLLSDRVNAVAVKELRQAMRSRIVTGLMIFFMFVLLCALSLALMDAGALSSGYSGRSVFLIMNGTLVFFALAFLPSYLGYRMSRERSDGFDLHFITTMSPGAIIRGKLLAGAFLLFMCFCVCLPFLTMTYLLRGIDIYSIFAILALSFILVLLVAQAGLFIACIPCSRFFKSLLVLFAAGLCLNLFAGSMTLFRELARSGVGSLFFTLDFWRNIVVGGLMLASVSGFLYVLTAQLITPPAYNRALLVRGYIAFFWVFSLATAVVSAVMNRTDRFLDVWFYILMVLISLSLLMSVSERDELSGRVKRAIPRGFLKAVLAFLFYQGGAGGVCFCIVMAGLTIFAAGTVPVAAGFSVPEWEMINSMSGFFLYFLAYSLAALGVRRSYRWLSVRKQYTWVIALIIMAVVNIVPLFLNILVGNGSMLYRLRVYGNPFVSVGSGNADFTIVTLIAGAVFLYNLPWIMKRVRLFFPLQVEDDND